MAVVDRQAATVRRRIFGIMAGLTEDEKSEARKNIDEFGGPSARFWILLLLSTVIAAFGLLINSAAVIIGAMIIAPLMGPIIASALAIDAGDTSLLLKALTAEVLGALAAIVLSMLIGHMPFQLGVSTEMLARATPTLYDLFIAAASGLAGAYATVDTKVSSTLAGVAISVALVPPLASCGLFIAMGSPANAWGAFLLFTANFLAIQIGAGVVFFVYGVADVHELRQRPTMRMFVRFGPSLVLLLAIGGFMTSTLINIARARTLDAKIEQVLKKEIGARTGGQLDHVIRQSLPGGGYEVIAVALTPQPFDSGQVEMIEKVLRAECKANIHLVVRSLSSSDADKNGQVFLTEAQLGEMRQRQAEQSMLAKATEVMNRHLANVPGAKLVNLLQTHADGSLAFTAVVRTPTALVPAQVADIEASLTKDLGATTALTVRSVLTRDANSTRFLYDPQAEVKTLSPTEEALRKRIRSALESRISQLPGAVLSELQIAPLGSGHKITAIVQAPVLVTPEQVKQYESDLRTYIEPGLSLEVQTSVAGTATPGGWSTKGPAAGD